MTLMRRLWGFWKTRGHLAEGRRHADLVLAREDIPLPDELRCEALSWAANLAFWQGDLNTARAQYEECRSIHRKHGNKAGCAWGLHGLSMVALGEGNFEEARTLLDGCQSLLRETGHGYDPGINNLLGIIAQNRGDLAEARALFEGCVTFCRSAGDLGLAVRALGNLGCVALADGDLTSARAFVSESLSISREIKDMNIVEYNLRALAQVLSGEKQEQRSCVLYGAAEALRLRLGSVLNSVESTEHETHVAIVRGVLDELTFRTAWQVGHAMTWEQAISFALEETPD
jgi:tetratricopeptide (TPR) repeat protein